MKNFKWKTYLPWVIFVALGGLMIFVYQNQQTRTSGREITFSELLVQIDEGRVHDVIIAGNEVSGHFTDNRSFQTYAPDDPTLVRKLQDKNVQISIFMAFSRIKKNSFACRVALPTFSLQFPDFQ